MTIPSSITSWIPVPESSDFPIQNLPMGWATLPSGFSSPVTRIGDTIVAVGDLVNHGLLPPELAKVRAGWTALTKAELAQLRETLMNLYRSESEPYAELIQIETLLPLDQVILHTPVSIPAFVDFYSGIHHASNVGKMFRPDQPPLLPNYRHLPVGYNGRASSVVVSGTPIRRPKGQTKAPNDENPTFGPTKEMDFELEVGFFLHSGNAMGEPIEIELAEEHILGIVLVNDWSARDVQRWEYQPLGPFLAKSFGTTVSPWVIALDALEPFRVSGPDQEPAVLPHLKASTVGHFDIQLEVSLQPNGSEEASLLCQSNTKHLYWSFSQQLAHQTSNGTPTEAGDLYASGTISGPDEGSYGSMLELTWKGTKPITIQGQTRTFLEDGDTLTLRGFAQGDGYRIGFGEASGTVLPA